MNQTRSRKCLLCRREGTSDSIEHYATCSFTRRLYWTKLNMEPALFANLHAWTLCSPCIKAEEQLLGVGMAIYAVYNTTNRLRFSKQSSQLSEEDRYQMLAQSVKEAVKGHDRACNSLLYRWARDREDRALTFGHDVWDSTTLNKLRCVWNRRHRREDNNGSWLDRQCAVVELQPSPLKRRRMNT